MSAEASLIVAGTKATGYIPRVQSNGTIAWEAVPAPSSNTVTPDMLKSGGTDGYVLVKSGSSWSWIDPATQTELSAHTGATTSVHGIADTSALETTSGAQAKANAAQTAAATDATSKVAAHEADTTNVHGIADTSALVLTSDSRLSDTRTPTDASTTTAKLAANAVTTAKLSMTPMRRYHKASQYVSAAANTSTLALTDGRQYWIPFESDGLTTYDRIGLWLTTLAAASVVRLGRYNDNGSFYPGTLISDDGTVDTATGSGSGKDITISDWTPAAGIYWLSGAAQGGAPTCVSVNGMPGMFRGDQSAGSAGYFLGGVTGAFASSPVGASNALSAALRVVLRVKTTTSGA